MEHSGKLQPHSCSATYVRDSLYQEPWSRVSADMIHAVNACDPQNFEPNLALNLEISDMINAKKGSA